MKKTLQERVNRRLSGLRGDELRRMRIRAVVQQERSAISPMKKKLSPVLVCLLILLFVTASVALAEHLNLFHLFGQQDERYAQVADEAAVITAQPVEGYEAPLEQGIAQIDNAYYDGLTLNLALSIAQGTQYEAYTPTAQELAAMEEASPMAVDIPDAQAPARTFSPRTTRPCKAAPPTVTAPAPSTPATTPAPTTASTFPRLPGTAPTARTAPIMRCGSSRCPFPQS